MRPTLPRGRTNTPHYINPQTIMEKLPFDIITLILPQLDLFDIARCRLVSKGFYRVFTDDEVARFALKRLFHLAPESFAKEEVGNAELTRLIARTSRWIRKDPSKVDRVLVAKDSTRSDCLGWGVAGDILVYQTPTTTYEEGNSEIHRSTLVLQDLSRARDEVRIELGNHDPFFDALDLNENNKWHIWIPQSPDRGDKFLTGQKGTPNFMMVASHPRTTAQLEASRGISQRIKAHFSGQRSQHPPDTKHQALAIISLQKVSYGQVICTWTINDEINCFDANSEYFTYSKKGMRHKYNIMHFSDILPSWPLVHKTVTDEEVKTRFKTFAFSTFKEIVALGSDTKGKYAFVCFGPTVQIVCAMTGKCLVKGDLSMPPLSSTVPAESVKRRFTFLQSSCVEYAATEDSPPYDLLSTDLKCHILFDEVQNDLVQHREATAIWACRAKITEDDQALCLDLQPAFMTTPKVAKQHTPSSLGNSTLASNKLHQCFALTSVRVNAEEMRPNRGSHAYHQQRGMALAGSIPTIITNLYDVAIFDDTPPPPAKDADAASKSAKWLQPTAAIHVISGMGGGGKAGSAPPSPGTFLSKSKHTAVKKAESKIPKPTVDCAPIVIGCGWVVFAKDRRDQHRPKNLFGRLGDFKRTDELVIVRFD